MITSNLNTHKYTHKELIEYKRKKDDTIIKLSTIEDVLNRYLTKKLTKLNNDNSVTITSVKRRIVNVKTIKCINKDCLNPKCKQIINVGHVYGLEEQVNFDLKKEAFADMLLNISKKICDHHKYYNNFYYLIVSCKNVFNKQNVLSNIYKGDNILLFCSCVNWEKLGQILTNMSLDIINFIRQNHELKPLQFPEKDEESFEETFD